MNRFKAFSGSIIGPLSALIIVFIVASLTTERFLHFNNLSNNFLQVSIISIIAIGSTIVILTGGIDLSPGSMVALLTMVFGTLIRSDQSIIFSMISVIILGSILGGVNGLVTCYLKIPAFVTTLAAMSIYRGIAFLFNDAAPIFSLSPTLPTIFYGKILNFPVVVLYIFFFYGLAYFFLTYTEKGRQIYAVGGNSASAKYSGINVQWVSMLSFILAGLTAGAGAVLLAARLNSGSPNYGVGMELKAIAAAVIGGASLYGGKGNIICTFFGAAIVVIVHNVMNLHNVKTPYQNIVVGSIIVLAVLVDVWRGFLFEKITSARNTRKSDARYRR